MVSEGHGGVLHQVDLLWLLQREACEPVGARLGRNPSLVVVGTGKVTERGRAKAEVLK
jgi:hypothetical protein